VKANRRIAPIKRAPDISKKQGPRAAETKNMPTRAAGHDQNGA
jgi:hypothetical protein